MKRPVNILFGEENVSITYDDGTGVTMNKAEFELEVQRGPDLLCWMGIHQWVNGVCNKCGVRLLG